MQRVVSKSSSLWARCGRMGAPWMVGAWIAVATGWCQAQTALFDVQVRASAPNESVGAQVLLTLSAPVVPLNSFMLDSGRSLVVDLPDVVSMKGRQVLPVDGGLLSRVSVASSAQRTRLVVQATVPMRYRIVQESLKLRVELSPRVTPQPSQPAASPASRWHESLPLIRAAADQAVDLPVNTHVFVSASPVHAPVSPEHAPVRQVVAVTTAPLQKDARPSWRQILTNEVAPSPDAVGGAKSVVPASGAGDIGRGSSEVTPHATVPKPLPVAPSERPLVRSLAEAKALLAQAKALTPSSALSAAVVSEDIQTAAPVATTVSPSADARSTPPAKLAQVAPEGVVKVPPPFAPALARSAPIVVPARVAARVPAVSRDATHADTVAAGSPEVRVLPQERRISLQFQSVDIRSVLQAIADFSGFNVVASDGVKGDVTVQIKDVPWREALQVILDAKGLGMRERDQVIWVAPNADLLAYQENEIKAREAGRQLEPLISAVFRLNYAKVDQVLTQIGASESAGRAVAPEASPQAGLKPSPTKVRSRAGSLLSARGVAFTDVRTNQLFVTDSEKALEAVRAFIRAVDVPLRQVLIEAKIVEADDTFSRNLGVKLGVGNVSNVTLGPRIGIGPNYNAVSATGATSVLPFVNLPASGINGSDAATFAISLFGASASRFLNLEVSALEADGRGKIVSSPRIVTADQVTATIEQGTEYPYQTATSSGATAVEFRKANLKLEVSPQITPGGYIILDVDINKDSRGETTAAGIAINTKHVKTQVLVENGGTLVIGGILEEYERNEVSKVPGLGDLPIIGNVFKSTRRQTDKAEVVVFLTPRVIQQQNAGFESDRTGRYARLGQINGCPDAGQASGTAACGQ